MGTIWEFFFSLQPNQLIGTIVNLGILVVGAVGVVELINAFRQLRQNVSGLTQFEKDVKQLTKDVTPDQILNRGRSRPEDQLLRRRIEIVQELHAAGADIEPSALAGLAVGELDRAARWSRWAASTVVLFGLGGTLVGLSQAVIRAQPLLGKIATGQEATQAVIATFSGLGTAFSTTLMGILWAVILGVGLGRFRRAQGQYLQRLEEVSLVRVYPHFRTSPGTALVEAAKQLTALEQRLGGALTEIVGQVKTQGLALTKVVEDSIGDLVLDARSTGDNLRKVVTESMSQLVRETHERGVALTSTVDRSFTALTEDLRTGTVELVGRLEATQKAMHALLGEPGANTQTLAQNLSMLQTGVQSMSLAAEKMIQMAPAVEEVLARQLDRQSRDLHETMHAYTGRLGSSLEKQEALLEQGFHRLEQGMGGFGDVLLSQLQEHDKDLLGEVKSKTGLVADAVTKQNLLVEQGLKRLEEGLAGFGEVLQGQLQEHHRSLFDDIVTQVGLIQGVIQQQGGILEGLREASDRLSEAVGHVHEPVISDGNGPPQSSEAAALLTAKIDELGLRLDRLSTAIEAVSLPPDGEMSRGPAVPSPNRTDPGGFRLPDALPGADQRHARDYAPETTPVSRVVEPARPFAGPRELPRKQGFFARLFGGR